ncbi:MAG: AMP-binding protein [Comamonadaceae bacterium]|nr:AMP-binding protein [Comamonadaceae bacterium]
MYSRIHEPHACTLTDALSEWAASQPDTPWLHDSQGSALTVGHAFTDSQRFAGFLHQLGVQPEERVGVFMSNSCAMATTVFGIGYLRSTAVMLNTELRSSFLRHQLNDCQLATIVVDAALVEHIVSQADELPHLKTLIVLGEGHATVPGRWRHVAWLDNEASPPWKGPAPQPQDIFCIMYTSGTTGPSKGVLMPHCHCAMFGLGAMRSMEVAAHDKYYICLPLFHANGLLMQLGTTVLARIPAFLKQRFSASTWLADIRATGATLTHHLGTTAMFVINQPPTAQDRNHNLRACMSGPNPAQHEAVFRERFGVKDVLSGFGMTEVGIPIWGRLGHSAPNAAGWAHEDRYEICIADPDTDAPVPAGQTGEILVRPKVPFGFMAGYLNVPEKTVEAWRNLWFHTGDAGIRDAQGLITFVDRIKDCIRRRGENISATEVEAVVGQLPGIHEVAAYAVPAQGAGGEDEVMLALVPSEGATLDMADIVRQASAQLPRFAKPRYLRQMDSLPKTATGKIQRAILRQQGSADAYDAEAAPPQ